MPDTNPRGLTAAERLLVLAALGERDVARYAWLEWLRTVGFNNSDAGSFAVLPAVARNLARRDLDDIASDELRNAYKYATANAQATLRDVALVNTTLAAAEVRVVAQKGLHVASRYLGDIAAIRSDQIDVLIDARDLDDAAEALAERGWQPAGRMPRRSIRRAFDAHVFAGGKHRTLVLRWRAFPLETRYEHEHALFERARPALLDGTELLMPEPTDQALLACAQFASLPRAERVRWYVETCALFAAEDGVDHPLFIRRATGADMLRRCVEAFAALQSAVGTSLSSVRLPALPPQASVAQSRRVFFKPDSIAGRVTTAFASTWQQYTAVCEADGLKPTMRGFVSFAKELYAYKWNVEPDQLFRAAWARLRS